MSRRLLQVTFAGFVIAIGVACCDPFRVKPWTAGTSAKRTRELPIAGDVVIERRPGNRVRLHFTGFATARDEPSRPIEFSIDFKSVDGPKRATGNLEIDEVRR